MSNGQKGKYYQYNMALSKSDIMTLKWWLLKKGGR